VRSQKQVHPAHSGGSSSILQQLAGRNLGNEAPVAPNTPRNVGTPAATATRDTRHTGLVNGEKVPEQTVEASSQYTTKKMNLNHVY
jgi:hypothetical protein